MRKLKVAWAKWLHRRAESHYQVAVYEFRQGLANYAVVQREGRACDAARSRLKRLGAF